MANNILTVPTYVESPFIILDIGGYTFGATSKTKRYESNGLYYKIQYPNYLDSLTVVKVNGEINSYTIRIVYPITPGDDPNFFDKVFSSVGYTSNINIKYGDWNSPSYIYDEQNCLLQDVKQDIDFASPKIVYTLTCLGSGYRATVNKRDYGPVKNRKPSEIIKSLVYDNTSGILEAFPGMRNKKTVESLGFLNVNDAEVAEIPSPGQKMSSLEYMNYLIGYMYDNASRPSLKASTVVNDDEFTGKSGSFGNGFTGKSGKIDETSEFSGKSGKIPTSGFTGKSGTFGIVVHDDFNNQYGGPYFEVVERGTDTMSQQLDTYEINIGYPDETKVSNFKVIDNQEFALVENYTENMAVPNNYTYRINTHGVLESAYAPFYQRNEALMKTTDADINWFNRVSQYPITATLTIKGLVRASILMSYLKVNTLFYGRKHNTSGLYVITKQTDIINSQGFKTTLELLKVEGDSISTESYGNRASGAKNTFDKRNYRGSLNSTTNKTGGGGISNKVSGVI